jgi:hypothetical protein
MEAKRRAVNDPGSTDIEPGVAQNWAQFFVSEKTDDAKSLKRSGEPGRTRTYNPLITPETLSSWLFLHFLACCRTVLEGVLGGFVPKDVPSLNLNPGL